MRGRNPLCAQLVIMLLLPKEICKDTLNVFMRERNHSNKKVCDIGSVSKKSLDKHFSIAHEGKKVETKWSRACSQFMRKRSLLTALSVIEVYQYMILI